MNESIFDPRVFISPPYIDCPYCGKQSFGVLMIGLRSYSRRCKECMRPSGHEVSATYPLPPLSKKIIYLDQSAVSDMMKVLNHNMNAYKNGRVSPYWKDVFMKLDRLCKLQLVVCPESTFHEMESIITEHFEAYRRMYWQLSGGVSFYHPDQIGMRQITEHVKAWISGRASEQSLNATDVIDGDINAWQERIMLHANYSRSIQDVAEIKRKKTNIYSSHTEVFHRWQQESNRGFDDWFIEECYGYGRGMLQVYEQYYVRAAGSLLGSNQITFDAMSAPPAVYTIKALRDEFEATGVTEEESLLRVADFLFSPEICDVPFIRLNALLYAAIAYRAAKTGKKSPPGPGMSIDISSISMLMPYCDAMFVDRECHSLLNENNVVMKLPFKTRIFSRANKEDFIEYLGEIEESASLDHLAVVNEVYGDDWPAPYTSMYEDMCCDSSPENTDMI